ncbi:MAG: LolA-like putative outer membrane lipoprotein chaperone [Alistipes sp.]
MKKNLIFVVALLLCCAQSSVAVNGRAAEILNGLASHVRALGRYEVAFSVVTGEQTTAGFYAVQGNNYYIHIGDAEVYGDAATRYEVNNKTKEVSIDKMDASARNILNNPTRAFDLVGNEFTVELLWERGTTAAVRLTPKSSKSSMSTMTVTVDTQQMQPKSLLYDFDGNRVEITVQRMSAAKSAPRVFNRVEYKTYELIDFR